MSLFVWKQIFSKPRYIITAIIVAILFYVLNAIVQGYKTILSFTSEEGFLETISLIINLSIGFHKTLQTHSTITLIITSILVGILFALIGFKVSLGKTEKKSGILGTIAIFLGLLAPGCAACGIGLVAALGLSSIVITFLPYKGLEISIIAIVILIIAIFKISRNLVSCTTNTHKSERGYKYGRR